MHNFVVLPPLRPPPGTTRCHARALARGRRARQPLRARLNMQGFPSQIVLRMPDQAARVLQSVFVSQIPVLTM